MAYPRCPCAWVNPMRDAEEHLEKTCKKMQEDSKHHRATLTRLASTHAENHRAVIGAKREIGRLESFPNKNNKNQDELLRMNSNYASIVAKATASNKALLDDLDEWLRKTKVHEEELRKVKTRELCNSAKSFDLGICKNGAQKIAEFQSDILEGLSFDKELAEKNAHDLRAQKEYGHNAGHVKSAQDFARDSRAVEQQYNNEGPLAPIPDKIRTTGTFYPRTDSATGDRIMVDKDGQVHMRYNSSGQLIQQRDSTTGVLYNIDPVTKQVTAPTGEDPVPRSITNGGQLTRGATLGAPVSDRELYRSGMDGRARWLQKRASGCSSGRR